MDAGEPGDTTVTADSISRFIHTFIAIVLMAVVLNPASVQGQTAADLFDPDVVKEIRLPIDSRDLRELHEHHPENTYYTRSLVAGPAPAGRRRAQPRHRKPQAVQASFSSGTWR